MLGIVDLFGHGQNLSYARVWHSDETVTVAAQPISRFHPYVADRYRHLGCIDAHSIFAAAYACGAFYFAPA